MTHDELKTHVESLCAPGALDGYFTAKRLYDILYKYIYINGKCRPMRDLFSHWQVVLVGKYYSYDTGLWRDVSI